MPAQKKKKSSKPSETKKAKKTSQSMLVPVSMILIVVFAILIAFVYYMQTKIMGSTHKPPTGPTAPIGGKSGAEALSRYNCIPVYFYDPTAQYFVPVHVPLSNEAMTLESRAKTVVEKLIEGPPPGSSLQSVMPTGTKLNSVKVEDDLAVVDLNQAVLSYGGGSSWEKGIVQSLLLSITELPKIDRVQILIDGKKKEYLPEGTVIEQPLERGIGPNADQPPPEGKPSGYLYYLDSTRTNLIPVFWTWDGNADDPAAKIQFLYSSPPPSLQSLANPAPEGLKVLECKIEMNTLILVIDHPDFANIFSELSARRFLEATYLTLYAVKPFTKAEIKVGSGVNLLPLWSYAPFSSLESMEIPPLCYNQT